jgi:protein-L-isoaspartate(D-aspartate) O-methyltransferase
MAAEPELSRLRARYARDVTAWARDTGLETTRVEAAFATVPRERYLTPPPWRIFAPGGLMEAETADPAGLYADVLVVLDRAKGINNGQPSLHAAWLAELAPRHGESALQVGIGAGYYTAILAALVGETGRVCAYEIDPRLAAIARGNLGGLPQVEVRGESAVGGRLPAVDLVYVSAGAGAPDPAWLRALRTGGRLVMPWQPAPGRGRTLLVERADRGFAARLGAGVSFVPCAGLGEARPRGLPSRPLEDTRSAWLTADRTPDGSATAIYEDLWFSRTRLDDTCLSHRHGRTSPALTRRRRLGRMWPVGHSRKTSRTRRGSTGGSPRSRHKPGSLPHPTRSRCPTSV